MSDLHIDTFVVPVGDGSPIPDGLEIRGLSGLSPDKFSSLLAFLVSEGVTVGPLAEAELEADILLSEEDFRQVAEAHELKIGVSTRTWNSLSSEWARHRNAVQMKERGEALEPWYDYNLRLPIGQMKLFNEFDLIILKRLEEARKNSRLIEGAVKGLGTVGLGLIDAVIEDTNQKLKQTEAA